MRSGSVLSLLPVLGVFAFTLFQPDPARAQPVLQPTRAVARHSSRCLDIEGGSTADGARAIQFDCHGAQNQQFTLKPGGRGFQAIAGHSGKCLAVRSRSTASGAQVEQTTCAIDSAQIWRVTPSGEGFQLRAQHSGQCMTVQNGATGNVVPLVQSACVGAQSQQFTLPTPAAPLSLTAEHSGKCADIEFGSAADGARAIQFGCGGNANQRFSLTQVGSYFRLRAQHSDKCLAVENASAANAAQVIQQSCASGLEQRWSVAQYGARYQIVAAHSGKCLNVSGATSADSAPLIQWPCVGASNELWNLSVSGSTSSGPGLWSSLIPLPIVPVAAANLPSGQLLLWSAYDRLTFGGDNGRTYTAIYNPANNAATERLVSETGHDMFCPGTANLADGRVLVNGGSSSTKTSIYNPFNNTWQTAQPMALGRGYQADAVLSTGEVFTIGGSWSGGFGGKDGEVWSSAGGWRSLSGAPATAMSGPDPAGVYRGDNHAWLFGTASGEVFHAGPSANMNWFGTASTGSNRPAGNRGDDAYAMNGNAAMFDIGRILKVGGAPAYQDANASTSAYVIDINNGVSVTRVANMAYARAFHSSVVLPNGQVVVVGGQTYPVPFTDTTAILQAELFTPATGTFQTMAAMNVPRTYHSVAILLPSGKVFVGGGGLCGGCTVNHPDAQIFTPPYLLNANGSARVQPAITSAPATVTWGGTADVTTSVPVTAFALLRLSSVTHTVNNDQRRVPLTFSSVGTNTYRLNIPSSRGVVLPGYYMLFALNAAGTPSLARMVAVQ